MAWSDAARAAAAEARKRNAKRGKTQEGNLVNFFERRMKGMSSTQMLKTLGTGRKTTANRIKSRKVSPRKVAADAVKRLREYVSKTKGYSTRGYWSRQRVVLKAMYKAYPNTAKSVLHRRLGLDKGEVAFLTEKKK